VLGDPAAEPRLFRSASRCVQQLGAGSPRPVTEAAALPQARIDRLRSEVSRRPPFCGFPPAAGRRSRASAQSACSRSTSATTSTLHSARRARSPPPTKRRWLPATRSSGDWQGFDPGAPRRQFDGLRKFRAEVERQALHVVVAEGRRPDPMPLLLTHGRPGSFLEYLKVLPVLFDPGAHGAD
jgi:Epoxide hydrolase N terminus